MGNDCNNILYLEGSETAVNKFVQRAKSRNGKSVLAPERLVRFPNLEVHTTQLLDALEKILEDPPFGWGEGSIKEILAARKSITHAMAKKAVEAARYDISDALQNNPMERDELTRKLAAFFSSKVLDPWVRQNWGALVLNPRGPIQINRELDPPNICLSYIFQSRKYEPPKVLVSGMSSRFPSITFTLYYFKERIHGNQEYKGGIELWGNRNEGQFFGPPGLLSQFF